MAKGATGRRSIGSSQRRASPYPLPSVDESLDSHVKDGNEIIAKEDWEDVKCSVCMEYPHNAVLLLCSSYDKGCRPYMCGTSFRYSNCLDQYKKHTKVTLPHHSQPHNDDTIDGVPIGPLSSLNMDKNEAVKLLCPLCRGQVKGWTVLEPAREHLNTKKRNCTQENCSFVGTYKELRKHVKVDHPSARPHKVDPALKQKWRRLELDRERDDVISTIRSSMPGSVVFGDYVIESINNGLVNSDEEDGLDANARIARIESNFMNMFMFLQAIDPAANIGSNRVSSRNERGTNRALHRGAAMANLRSPGFDPAANIGSNRVTSRNERDTNRALNRGAAMASLLRSGFDPAANIGSNRVSSRNERDTNRALNRGAAMASLLSPGFDHRRSLYHGASDEDSQGSGGASFVNRMRRHGRVLSGRSGRRQRLDLF